MRGDTLSSYHLNGFTVSVECLAPSSVVSMVSGETDLFQADLIAPGGQMQNENYELILDGSIYTAINLPSAIVISVVPTSTPVTDYMILGIYFDIFNATTVTLTFKDGDDDIVQTVQVSIFTLR